MRRCYLVAYDIRDPRRLRRIHRLLKAYGEPWQYSVFYCNLRDIDRVRLEADLTELADLRADQILILDLGEHDERVRRALTVLGPPLPEPDGGIIVV